MCAFTRVTPTRVALTLAGAVNVLKMYLQMCASRAVVAAPQD